MPSLMNRPLVSPTYAGCHSCQAVEECAEGVVRILGEGGHASVGSAEDTKGPRLLSRGAPPPSLTSLHDLVSLT